MNGWRPIDIASVAVGIVLLGIVVFAFNALSRSTIVGVLCCVICMVPTILKVADVVELPAPLIAIIVVSCFLHGFGLSFDLYTIVGFYDTVTHTLSSMTVGIVVFYAMIVLQYYGGGRVNFTGRGLALFTAMITMTFSVYWEVIEYFSDTVMDSVAQYSPYDTLTDLMCDALGTVLASFWVGAYMSRRKMGDVVGSFELNGRIVALLKSRQNLSG